MKLARITKDSADIRRMVVDFQNDSAGPWLDLNEVLSTVSQPVVVVEQGAVWQYGAFVNTPPTPPVDTTPLVVNSAAIESDGTQVQLMVGVGTPGLTYKITFIVLGSTSGRTKQIDLLITIREPV